MTSDLPQTGAESELKNASQLVFEAIRNGLANGTIEGDPTLSESMLASKVREVYPGLKFSRLHVRKAVATLEAEGLISVFPKRGTRLRILSNSELKEIWDNRVAIEEFVLIRLASNRNRSLKDATGINLEIGALALLPPSEEKHHRFLTLDKEFHESLAKAAGYPGLAHELSLLRLKLQVAAPVRKFDSDERYLAVKEEHDRILTAIGEPGTSPRPNLNDVRLAFLIHMKNSSRDSWKIDSRLRETVFCSQSNALDVPEFDSAISRDLMPLGNLLKIRLHTEYCAMSLLAARPGVDISLIMHIQNEMKALLKRRIDSDSLTTEEQLRFLDFDLSFHAAICYVAGMLFGEEVVNYTWHQVWKKDSNDLTIRGCNAILMDHDAILDSIRRSTGSHADICAAKRSIENHLLGTFVRNNFTSEFLRSVILEDKEGTRNIEKVLEELQLILHDEADQTSFRYTQLDN